MVRQVQVVYSEVQVPLVSPVLWDIMVQGVKMDYVAIVDSQDLKDYQEMMELLGLQVGIELYCKWMIFSHINE